MEQELYEEDYKVVILPDRQEVTSDDLATMPDVVRERVRYILSFSGKINIYHSVRGKNRHFCIYPIPIGVDSNCN